MDFWYILFFRFTSLLWGKHCSASVATPKDEIAKHTHERAHIKARTHSKMETEPQTQQIGKRARALSLRWSHNGRDGASKHQPHHGLLNSLFRHRSKKTWKLCVTGLCRGIHRGPVNSPHKWLVTQSFHVFIWWRHHEATRHFAARWRVSLDLASSPNVFRWRLNSRMVTKLQYNFFKKLNDVTIIRHVKYDI